jgi:hypothetical protein
MQLQRIWNHFVKMSVRRNLSSGVQKEDLESDSSAVATPMQWSYDEPKSEDH